VNREIIYSALRRLGITSATRQFAGEMPSHIMGANSLAILIAEALQSLVAKSPFVRYEYSGAPEDIEAVKKAIANATPKFLPRPVVCLDCGSELGMWHNDGSGRVSREQGRCSWVRSVNFCSGCGCSVVEPHKEGCPKWAQKVQLLESAKRVMDATTYLQKFLEAHSNYGVQGGNVPDGPGPCGPDVDASVEWDVAKCKQWTGAAGNGDLADPRNWEPSDIDSPLIVEQK